MKGNKIFIQILKYVFIFTCIGLFLFESKDCISQFMKYETLTKTTQEKQENYPLPWICIEASSIPEHDFSKLGLSSLGYRQEGKWIGNSSLHDAESVFNAVSDSFEDLVESVGIEMAVNEHSDRYLSVSLSMKQLIVNQCDYYSRLKCYCVHLNSEFTKNGVQEIWIKFKKNVVVSAIAPGNFYSRERKQARIRVEQGYKYEYFLQHKIINRLSGNVTCTEESNWKTDDCKLASINQNITNTFNCTTPWLLSFAR